MTQLLGAFAEFERTLIRERTRAGLSAAMKRGARLGNPKMRARDPVAIAEIRIALKERYLNELIDGFQSWLPTVQRLRPFLPWALVLRQIKAIRPPVRSFTVRTLVKACRALVKAGYADEAILLSAPSLPRDTRIARLVADRLQSHPKSSLRAIAAWLSHDLREPTPRGGLSWSPEGVRRAIAQAEALGLVSQDPAQPGAVTAG